MNCSDLGSGFCIGNNYKVALSNLYLDPLDQQMAQHGGEMVRYADEVVLCNVF